MENKIEQEGVIMVETVGELTLEQIIKCEDLITNLPQCSNDCPGNCPTCEHLIKAAVAKGYLKKGAELTNEQFEKVEDLVTNLPECNSPDCIGECCRCTSLINEAIEQEYISLMDIVE